ncbi:molybdate-binding protein [Microbacterium sorbitolivorans]|uniref:Molybdate ABC transporter substrate-binding protein n=1 Tax=Microbacterium sorbitolivorans TaxID=1867410 RepID=A0A367Y1L7_9MICO|nr:molybdate ABC transporter substrate-binding protein [Microbacterium sorbitolivorans]RCK59763.1 molybdate ABC transporter substrate-binding protein [Microbacterium sorbitolivorans]GGF39742.1 molybdate-binding protein [Microbacterium sorbitolivorans]
MTHFLPRAAASAALLGALVLSGCAAEETAPAAGSEATPVRIAAAASLNGVFEQLIAEFGEENPDIEVAPVVYDGSSTLATQIEEGADFDVAAFADEATMERIADSVPEPEIFATNSLVIAVPSGTTCILSLADLADPALTVVLCAAEVPCGAASEQALAAAGVDVEPASLEQNVTAVLTKVQAGDADAGLVYRTDAKGAEGVEAIDDADLDAVVNRYPIGTLASAGDDAKAFVDFVLSDEGQGTLAEWGFGAP